MLADQLDYVVGVDPHRDSHALAVVHVISGAIVLEATVAANSEGTRMPSSSSTSTLQVGAPSRLKEPVRSVRLQRMRRGNVFVSTRRRSKSLRWHAVCWKCDGRRELGANA